MNDKFRNLRKYLEKHFQGGVKYSFHFSSIRRRIKVFLVGKYANNRNHPKEVLHIILQGQTGKADKPTQLKSIPSSNASFPHILVFGM